VSIFGISGIGVGE